MASQAWLESTLRRSASLGREVLQRASRRSVDWTSTTSSQTPTTTDEDTQTPVEGRHIELNDAFATIADFMAQTTYQCKKFYDSCTEPNDIETNHVSRFHTRPAAGTTTTTPLPPRRHHGRMSGEGEDFYIEVSPGTYSITASVPESHEQTQLVSLNTGESVDLTFNL